MNDQSNNQNNEKSVLSATTDKAPTSDEPISDVAVGQVQDKTSSLRKILSNKKLLIVGAASVIVLSGVGTSYAMYQNNQTSKRKAAEAALTKKIVEQEQNEPVKTEPEKTVEEKTVTEKPKGPAVEQSKVPIGEPKETVAVANCLPADANQYVTANVNKTNSEYLQNSSFGDTTKFYSALEFAGLIGKVNESQITVFAPNDYVFTDKLTPDKLAWMNQSPENMKSVIGWHIVIGCITWAGVNPIEGKSGTTILNTLNGPVTLTYDAPGTVGNAKVGMWDWFTSNGSVTLISDFVQPPSVP